VAFRHCRIREPCQRLINIAAGAFGIDVGARGCFAWIATLGHRGRVRIRVGQRRTLGGFASMELSRDLRLAVKRLRAKRLTTATYAQRKRASA
jgi:hypothetical protein